MKGEEVGKGAGKETGAVEAVEEEFAVREEGEEVEATVEERTGRGRSRD